MNRPQMWKAADSAVRLFGLLLLSMTSAFAADLVSFDAPGASQGTFALAINPRGQITGFYFDSNEVVHGFVRSREGSFATFDAPGAGTGQVLGTFPSAINEEGTVTGYFFDFNLVAHGFVRAHNGAITTFDAPGATAGLVGTFSYGISADGTVAGNFYDVNFVSHGFVRHRDGAFSTIDDPDSGTGPFQGSTAFARNSPDAFVGCYTDGYNGSFNFLRTRKGAFLTLNPPGGAAGSFGCGAIVFSFVPFGLIDINASEVVTGTYFEPLQGNVFGGNYRGFLRHRDGVFVTFDAVASPSSPCCTWTFPVSINSRGEVAGYYNDYVGVDHAFMRKPNGDIIVLDPPNAQSTVAASMNEAGEIAGYYFDSNGAHGFSANSRPPM